MSCTLNCSDRLSARAQISLHLLLTENGRSARGEKSKDESGLIRIK